MKSQTLAVIAAFTAIARTAPQYGKRAQQDDCDPFAILDAQNYVLPDNMTWDQFIPVPGVNWADPARKGSNRNFNIALVAVDYPNEEFVILQEPGSTVFTNPQPVASEFTLTREDVPGFYRDFLNKPQDLNRNHTLHEYWMEDSAGRFGVDLTSFGPYRLPQKSHEYGIDDYEGGFNPGACPEGDTCSVDLRTDAFAAWRADVGNDTANSYELVFILSAGQDESSTWQEFGQMMFESRDDVTDEFGPPGDGPNSAATRYVNWTSWASASTIWPNAGRGSSTQGESSGMGVYAHELSHLLDIGDNYNNPYSDPPVRSYTGPWSMMSRGSFNGPGGPHTRWEIPARQGSSLGSLHTVRDKLQLGITENATVLMVSKEQLAASGPIIAELTARSVDSGLLGLRVMFGNDSAPACNQSTDPLCDGRGYNNYEMEVVDRMGADSFTPDHGVMISKTKDSDADPPFQWTIDANPQDIDVVDFYLPNGTAFMISIGDYRQLADALFHAGTNSGSEFEYVDEANGVHMYIIDINRDKSGVLRYTVGARALESSSLGSFGLEMSAGKVSESGPKGSTCSFELTNTGSPGSSEDDSLSEYQSDIYRLSADVEGDGWRVQLPNALAAAGYGQSAMANVAVGGGEDASDEATVILTATSESDPDVSVTKECRVRKG